MEKPETAEAPAPTLPAVAPTVPVDRKTALVMAFRAAVQERIGDDPQHGWGIEDSLAVIEAIVAEDASLCPAEMLAARYTLSDESLTLVKRVINPSQFRQILERQKRPDGRVVLTAAAKGPQQRETITIF